jgi:hypothetical protein
MIKVMFFFFRENFHFSLTKKSGKFWKKSFFGGVISTNFAILGANFAKFQQHKYERKKTLDTRTITKTKAKL